MSDMDELIDLIEKLRQAYLKAKEAAERVGKARDEYSSASEHSHECNEALSKARENLANHGMEMAMRGAS